MIGIAVLCGVCVVLFVIEFICVMKERENNGNH